MLFYSDVKPSPHFHRGSRRLGAALLAVVVWVACGSVIARAQGAPAGAGNAPGSSAPAPAAAPLPAAVAAPAGYTLGPDDQVAVEVFGEDDLRAAGRLNSEGSMSLPLLGPVRLAGLTTAQAAARITELLRKDYLVNPRVNVSLVGYAKRRFTVLGQVNRPGAYDMPEDSVMRGGIDLLEAIALAGGYTRIAAPGRITVVRRSERDGGQAETLRVDAKRLAKGQSGRPGQQSGFLVKPGDTITVDESIF